MNQITDPLLIDLARAAYTCPAARDALHDYWEDRGGQPLAVGFVDDQEWPLLWSRCLMDRQWFGGIDLNDGILSVGGLWVHDLPAVPFEETELQANIVWKRKALDLIASQWSVPRHILHGSIG